MKYFLYCLIILLSFYCTSKNKKTQSSSIPQIEIIDSIRVNFLGQITFRDYNPEKNTFLAQDYSNNTIIEIDGSELILQGTVKIPIENFIQRNPVPFSQSETYWEANRNIIQGSIKEIFTLDSGSAVLYAKGIPEEITQLYNQDGFEEREEMMRKHNPGYLAFFDKNHQLLTWDVLAPKGLIYTSIVNNKGEIITLKDQEYFGLEDDFITLYSVRVNWGQNK